MNKELPNQIRTGGCVCGAVRYRCSGEPMRVTICHCKWCQKRTGSAFGTEIVFNESQVTLSGNIQTYKHHSDESGRWLIAQFCPKCGTNLGFTLEIAPGIRTMAAGTFDDTRWINSHDYEFRYIYLKSKQPWSEVPENVETYQEHFRK